MSYIRICQGLTDKGKLIQDDEIFKVITDYSKDWYRSIGYYTEEQKKQFQVENTISGLKPNEYKSLAFDFDSATDLSLARTDALTMVQRLIYNDVPKEAIQIYFSGKKGFTIVVELEEILDYQTHKSICTNLGKGLQTLDQSLYTNNRILRIPYTKHQATSLYKIAISEQELQFDKMDTIKNKAKKPNVTDIDFIILEKLTDKLRGLKVEEKEERIKEVQLAKLDFAKKPKFLSNCKWALQNGHFKHGIRSNAMLSLASVYKNLGFDIEHTYRILKGVASLQAEFSGEDRFNDTELYNNICVQVYSNTWRGGSFTCKEDGWLKDYCNSLGSNSCSCKNDLAEINYIMDVGPQFKDFVQNIDDNTIKTGIKEIDDNVFITTGANVGILGAPGCHAKDTMVIMHDGSFKKVQDVVVGDLLMGPDSQPREVLKLVRGVEEMVEIKPFRCEPFVVNKSHMLNLTPSNSKNKLSLPGNINVTVKDYIDSTSRGDRTFLSSYKLHKKGIELPKKQLDIPPYILGLWLGDGTRDSVSLTSMDDEIKNEWIKYIELNSLDFRIQQKPFNKAVTISATGRRIVENNLLHTFRDLNLINNKHIPTEYMKTSIEDRLQLLAGLIDTDGTLDGNGTGWAISQKSETLIDQILELARSVGFHASKVGIRKSCYHNGKKIWGNYFKIHISANDPTILPVRLERKKPTKFKGSTNVNHYGFEHIKLLPEDTYYGFTIDKDHLYLTSDFMVHHNCGKSSIALNILNNTSVQGIPSVFASLDMSPKRMFEKILYKVSGKKRDELYKLFKENKEAELLEEVKKNFGNVNFFAKTGATVADLREFILQAQEREGRKIKLVVLDYFERVQTDFSDDTAASKKVAAELQDLVNDLDIALITLLQPNKNALGGGSDTPILDYTKIKGSSYLYQSFRIIMSLWRPFYNPKDFSNDYYMEMAVLKNDLGELNQFVMGWDGPKGEVYSLDSNQVDEFYHLLKQKEKAKEGDSDDF